MDKLTHAKYFATQEHVIKRQQTHGVLPYTHHLAAVEQVLVDFGFDEDYKVAAWLHDVVEDCDGVKLKNIEELFGERVGALVYAVTNEPGINRQARHAATYPKIVGTPGAIYLKLADRIANVECGGRLVKMYEKEHDAFKRAVATHAFNRTRIEDQMWDRLEGGLRTDDWVPGCGDA